MSDPLDSRPRRAPDNRTAGTILSVVVIAGILLLGLSIVYNPREAPATMTQAPSGSSPAPR